MTEYVMDTFNVVEKNWNVEEKWNNGKCLLISRGIIKHLHHVIYNTTWYHLLFTECQKEDLELVYKPVSWVYSTSYATC